VIKLLTPNDINAAVNCAKAAYEYKEPENRLTPIPSRHVEDLINSTVHLAIRLGRKRRGTHPSRKLQRLVTHRRTLGKIYDEIKFNWGREANEKVDLEALPEHSEIDWLGSGWEAKVSAPAIEGLKVALAAVDRWMEVLKQEQQGADPWLPFLLTCKRAFKAARGEIQQSNRANDTSSPFVEFVHCILVCADLEASDDASIKKTNNRIRDRWRMLTQE
jgi:hypothetical protein